MKLLWLCNRMPGAVKAHLEGKIGAGGLWVDHVLQDLRQQENLTIHLLAPGGKQRGQLDEKCSFAFFETGLPYEYRAELENWFGTELGSFQPDVIHIWGTEYAHTLAMVNACERLGLLDQTVVSIQGLCSVCAGHYAEGVPEAVQRRYTFRDLLRRDNIRQQQRKFALRGELEIKALQKARHVIGRTDWDYACTKQINPDAMYHFCNETLRNSFYEGNWHYGSCVKHRIFASSCEYSVKGFHYLLEAFGQIAKDYPDAVLAVTGRSFLPKSTKEALRQNSYEKYLADLARQYGVENKIEFLGRLTAEQMKAEYQKANVFALPSTIENSPNSLGEAMLLGVPCVAAHVGGVANLMTHEEEGYLYQPAAGYMLAHYIKEVFAMESAAETMGQKAKAHAAKTHDPQTNLQTLMNIYRTLSSGKEE